MTSPLLRLFAVFWWLLVIATVGFWLFVGIITLEDYQEHQSRGWFLPLSSMAQGQQLPQSATNAPVARPGTTVPPWDLPWQHDASEVRAERRGIEEGAAFMVMGLLPFTALIITRWIITSRWRFGPRW